MSFGLPRFDKLLGQEQQRWAGITVSLALEPVGLQPLRPDEGYLFLHISNQAETRICQFTPTRYADHEPGRRVGTASVYRKHPAQFGKHI